MEHSPADWNACSYQAAYSFVWEFGREIVELLAPRPGERILDVGCGTGQLTAAIARTGALVTGIDSSPAMIERARANFPELRFAVADVCRLGFHAEFEAVFSNAALHWVTEAEAAVTQIARALAPGGRFVAELGGRGNVQAVVESVYTALEEAGVRDPRRLNPWFYPSVAEYAAMLERNGFEVNYAALFDRPTPVEGEDGFTHWLGTFGRTFTDALPPERREEFHRRVNELAAPRLRRGGGWTLDYRRLRVAARRAG